MYVGGCFMAVYKRNDMRMVEAFQDIDLRRQILLQFLVQLGEVN